MSKLLNQQERSELKRLRARRTKLDETGAKVLEAAVCLAARLPEIDDHFAPEVLEAADEKFRGRIGLQQLLLEAARANGWKGRSIQGDLKTALQAGFSTSSLSGILSGAAQKFLLRAFHGVESVWRDIARVRPVSDFKQHASYRLTGGFEYEKVGPDGQLKHGTAGEESHPIKADTFANLFVLDRQSIINDDLGALKDLPSNLGRGAGLAVNREFWATFLDDASFFSAANSNLIEGASSALSITSMAPALQAFRDQVDEDGAPVSLPPAILLVPTALEVAALEIANSREVRNTTANTKEGTHNPFHGLVRSVVSAYLASSSIAGSSNSAWYLLANPAEEATIELAFLNGEEEPAIETAEADFETLGIQFRGYSDFGVALHEHRAGVKSTGA
ncbi:MAG: hypothetical protein DHS20C21_01900 [Gemmatimonadota bacterium]|nr:MAG: hypothetical protein DHS20C21_01900 [Gemmatimonadota bacterium]